MCLRTTESRSTKAYTNYTVIMKSKMAAINTSHMLEIVCELSPAGDRQSHFVYIMMIEIICREFNQLLDLILDSCTHSTHSPMLPYSMTLDYLEIQRVHMSFDLEELLVVLCSKMKFGDCHVQIHDHCNAMAKCAHCSI